MDIKALVDKYGLTKNDFWQLHNNWIVSHNACEKIAAIENITMKDIKVLNSEVDLVRFLITMDKDGIAITSVGEADIQNCKSKYLGCMAEKRGIDRCILKLINAYQYGIYSDVEADEFKKGAQQ